MRALQPPTPVLLPESSQSSPNDKFRRGLQLIEVETFFQLVLRGNHVATESLLVSPEKCYQASCWELIRDGPSPLSASHAHHYIGSAEALMLKGMAAQLPR